MPAASGLLANASDVDGDPLTISAFSIAGEAGPFVLGVPYAIPGAGTLTINSDGSYAFAPVANYTGPIPVITYSVSDGNGGTDTSTLALSMVAANDPPVDGNEMMAVTEDTPLNVPAASGLLANASDVDGDPLTILAFSIAGEAGPFVVGMPYAIPGVGTLTINSDGSYGFTPIANYTGPIPAITYTVSDGNGGTDTSTLTLSMVAANDPPAASNGNLTTPESVPYNGTLPIAIDADGDPLVYGPGATPPAHGTVLINPDGTYTYTPAPSYAGPDTFTYSVSDGTTVVERTIIVTVTPVNTPPAGVNDVIVIAPGSTPAPVNVLGNDTDADGDPLTIASATIDTNGDGGQDPIMLGAPTPITGPMGAPIGTITVAADGRVTFTPAPSYAGPIPSLTYVPSDGLSSGTPVTVTFVRGVTVDPPPAMLLMPSANDLSPLAIAVPGPDKEDVTAEGPVVATVRALNGSDAIGADGIVVPTVNALRVQDAALGTWSGDRHGGLDARPLSSHSLKLAATETGSLVTLEAFVRENTLMVHLEFDGRQRADLLEWKVQRADGRPLPEWLSFAGESVLIGHRAADAEAVDIRVIAILQNGGTVEHTVRLDPATGALQTVRLGTSGQLAPPKFWERIPIEPALTHEQRRWLGDMDERLRATP